MRRRGRGQNRKPSHHHHHHHQGRNQTFDSNGPGVRLRGTAHQIYEKYLMLGRDAASSGDRIMSENYYQHADHYYRIILANQGPLESFSERHEGAEPEMETGANGYGQGEQPAAGEGQPPQAYGNTLPQPQSYNGAGPSPGSSLPGPSQPRPESEGQGQGGGQGQHGGGFRRDRFRRFRDRREGRDGDRQGQYSEQGGDRREGREEGRQEGNRQEGGRHQRHQRPQEDEAFEPPAFLKAERPAGEAPPRDPFNRDDEQR